MYLFSRQIDWLFLLLPVWLVWLVLFFLPDSILLQEIPIWVWFLLVVGIDVSHVWSSLFRTYFDPHDRVNHQHLIRVLPVLVFFFCFAASYASVSFFWRLMAYLALFHFVKQQFGFMALYAVKNGSRQNEAYKWDKYLIYFSMLYPVLYWHLHDDLHFSWFVSDDFLLNHWFDLPKIVFLIGNWVYWMIIGYWLIQKIRLGKKEFMNQLPMILWILTTAGNWYLGIVYFNSDLAFTATNVVAHGIPYLVLIVYYKKKKDGIVNQKKKNYWRIALLVIGVCLFFGVIEEYLWDLLVNQDKKELFSSFLYYVEWHNDNRFLTALFIGILSVPQVTHYVLDAYIWKNNDSNPFVKKVFSSR
ncbi:MAG: hypothetical protein KDC84_05850 [Crocinitomicaceae bacterium]|nr:hypothetical protein [Crocinitomicaceae bacterium]